LAGRRAPDNAEIARMEAAAAEAEDVLKNSDHESFAKAAGLRNAVAAGLTPPAAFVTDVRAALQQEMKKTGASASSTEVGIDSGMTRATKVTLRGVLKRFENAFGAGPLGGSSAAKGRREK
jgi:hypothetical protein